MELQLSQHFCRATKNILLRDISFMSRGSDTDFYTFRSCNARIFSLTSIAVLRHTA